MPSSVRPKGSTGGTRAPPVTPMSERQQMALLMQMTSQANETGPRSPSSASRLRDRNERGETPLHLAAIKGDVEQVSKLLAHRSDPNVADFAGWTPLHEACNHGWYEVAFRLVQAGANVNARGLDNDTPLHDAAINGHLRLVKMLVEHGADIHIKNSKGKAPLDVAASPTVMNVMLNPNFPITEQTNSTRVQPRSRDEKKLTDPNKSKTTDDAMDTTKASTSEDVYDFKPAKDDTIQGDKTIDTPAISEIAETIGVPVSQIEDSNKRPFADVEETTGDDVTNEDETKRKKPKTTVQRSAGQKGPNKQTATSIKASTSLKSADCPSPKSTITSSSDAEVDDGKTDLKVPPLKIVIPQGASEQETGSNRNGKSSSQRSHQALPYVVTSTSSDIDKDATTSATNSPPETTSIVKNEDKKESVVGSDDQRAGHHQRVLRSSHRSGSAPQGSTDRSSNNSSPQLQRSNSPSPSASPSTSTPLIQTETTTIISNTSDSSITTSATATSTSITTTITTSTTTTTSTTPKISDTQVTAVPEVEPVASTSITIPSTSSTTTTVELHPRKRKMKQSKDTAVTVPLEQLETPTVAEVHPYEQPITNGYQLFLNIRKQIEKRRKSLFPVQPKPPQGFSDYLLNTCTYVLAGKAPTVPNITIPSTLPSIMADLFSEQEKERYRLRMQHVIEKEKMVLSVEQEILRVHGRAARALANHSLPFSACTILRDEEVYNLITPEQEEKDRNARSRYNGRLFLSWLQDLDDKWEKIKERMILRHHNEAESLHAVQKMDWEWKLKELSLCDAKSRPTIDEAHVPMVDVSDELNLLIIESGP